jgi:hypothetical protein
MRAVNDRTQIFLGIQASQLQPKIKALLERCFMHGLPEFPHHAEYYELFTAGLDMEVGEVIQAIEALASQGVLVPVDRGSDGFYFDWPSHAKVVEAVPAKPTTTAPTAQGYQRKDGYRRHRTKVFERDGHQCVYCGSTEDLELDHVVPVNRGGSNSIDNLATCCKTCNSRKRDMAPAKWFAQLRRQGRS